MKIKVTGRRYCEAATYYDLDKKHDFPKYEKLAEVTYNIEADSVKAGERWLAENHPDMYMGGNVSCENGDFACLAVPCGEYGDGNYETIEARVAWVRKHIA